MTNILPYLDGMAERAKAAFTPYDDEYWTVPDAYGWCLASDRFEAQDLICACSPERIRALVACVRAADIFFCSYGKSADMCLDFYEARAQLDKLYGTP